MIDACHTVHRRMVLAAMIAGPLALPALAAAAPQGLSELVAKMERRIGGRIGVACFSSRTGMMQGYRLDQRFPMCSVFKLFACAATLARADRQQDRLDAQVLIREDDRVPYAPVTERHMGGTMTVADLCAAAVRQSDNVAANMLLRRLGGPAGVTRFAMSLGDRATRLDRWEPELNTAIPGDVRDTTTPAAMARSVGRIMDGDALCPRSRALLLRWLQEARTGLDRIRAGLPATWTVGDKTGSGANGTANDVAWLQPPGGEPLVLAVFLTGTRAGPQARDAVFADIARHVANSARR